MPQRQRENRAIMEEPKKHEFNTQDIIANLRFIDPYLVKLNDFIMSIPILCHPLLLQIGTVLVLILLPLMGLVAFFVTIASIFVNLFTFNFIGILTGILAVLFSLGYLFWVSRFTIFSKDSDLKASDLGTWSKMLVYGVFAYLIIDGITNMAVSSIGGLVRSVIHDIIFTALFMYLIPFTARYFEGVILDGLAPHPDAEVPNPHA